jgi:hypothetical protein
VPLGKEVWNMGAREYFKQVGDGMVILRLWDGTLPVSGAWRGEVNPITKLALGL